MNVANDGFSPAGHIERASEVDLVHRPPVESYAAVLPAATDGFGEPQAVGSFLSTGTAGPG